MQRGEWEAAASAWLASLSEQSLRRNRQVVRAIDATHVEIDGQRLVNFSSNDYLGLSHHVSVIDACREAVHIYGSGAGAAALITGQTPLHAEAEDTLAAWKRAEAAVLLPSGYQANLAAVQTLTAIAERSGKPIRFLLDKLCHASLIDAVRGSGAPYRVFPHNGMDKLRRLLASADAGEFQVVVTESIFSMDGDAALLNELSLLKLQYSFLLLLDEAHSSGVYGTGGRGLADELGMISPADVSVVTLSKAFGCGGGAVCASRVFCDSLINSARAYIYSTAIPPMIPAALIAALNVMQNEPELQSRVRAASTFVRRELKKLGYELPQGNSPIIPIVIGDELRTLQAANQLRSAGYLCVAIRPPTVAPNTARLRVTLSAQHLDSEITGLLAELNRLQA